MDSLVLSGDFMDFNDESTPLDITMRNSTSMGEIQGMGKIELSAIESVNVINRTVDYYVEISITYSGRTGFSILNLEDASKVLFAIDKIKFASPSMTKFKNFQASYRDEKDFRITAFSDKDRRVAFSVAADNVSALLMQPSQLDDMKKGITEALSYIKDNRIEPANSGF